VFYNKEERTRKECPLASSIGEGRLLGVSSHSRQTAFREENRAKEGQTGSVHAESTQYISREI